MKLGIAPGTIEGSLQGRTPGFQDYHAMIQVAEQIGLDSFWLPDHLIYHSPEKGEQGCWEVFTFLSALAAITTRITFGTLVACTAFRSPALLAKMADSLDEISGGRFILGLGAGWYEAEYKAFGYPFDHRASRFEEALHIIVPLLRQGRVDFHGRYYQASNCILRPRGTSPSGPPILIGASQPRMLQAAAKYADAWNMAYYQTPAMVKEKYEQLKEACLAVGRDPATIEATAGTRISLLEAGEEGWLDEAISGSPEEIAKALTAFAEIGVNHLIVRLDPMGVEGIERFARVVELLRRDGSFRSGK
jgi:probable F420-dependent oxidoreductase